MVNLVNLRVYFVSFFVVIFINENARKSIESPTPGVRPSFNMDIKQFLWMYLSRYVGRYPYIDDVTVDHVFMKDAIVGELSSESLGGRG